MGHAPRLRTWTRSREVESSRGRNYNLQTFGDLPNHRPWKRHIRRLNPGLWRHSLAGPSCCTWTVVHSLLSGDGRKKRGHQPGHTCPVPSWATRMTSRAPRRHEVEGLRPGRAAAATPHPRSLHHLPAPLKGNGHPWYPTDSIQAPGSLLSLAPKKFVQHPAEISAPGSLQLMRVQGQRIKASLPPHPSCTVLRGVGGLYVLLIGSQGKRAPWPITVAALWSILRLALILSLSHSCCLWSSSR